MARPWLLFALAAALGSSSGCGTTSTAARDAGARDGSVVDAGALDADADAKPPPGDPCGDLSGLEADSPWPMPGGCPKRPGFRPKLQGAGQPTLSFSFGVASRPTSPVVAADGSVYFGTAEGKLDALSGQGKKKWDVDAGAPITQSPVVLAGGHVVFVTTSGKITLVGADGEQKAQATLPPSPSSPLVGPDGTLYLTASDGKLHALAKDTLAERYASDVGDAPGSEPGNAVTLGDGGVLWVATRNGSLSRVTFDGRSTVVYKAGAGFAAAPSVTASGDVVAASSDGTLHMIGPDGTLRYRAALGSASAGGPALSPEGAVYVPTRAGKLLGIDQAGKEIFAFAPFGIPSEAIVGSDGIVYFGADDGKFYAVAPSGRLVWAASARSPTRAASALSGSGLVLVPSDGALVGLGP